MLQVVLLENQMRRYHRVISVRTLLVRIFPHSDWIRRDTEYLSVFNLNAGEYGPQKLWTRTLFTQCWLLCCMIWLPNLIRSNIENWQLTFRIGTKVNLYQLDSFYQLIVNLAWNQMQKNLLESYPVLNR